MVPLPLVRASNANLKSLPPPTALFVGATQGIGLSTLQHYASFTTRPRIYIVGRSEPVVANIVDDLKKRNADGEYIFLYGEVSLLESVDAVCAEVRRRERSLALLFMSPGYLTFAGRDETPEGIDRVHSLRYYARARFITLLLPLLQQSLAPRVLSVLAAGNEGSLYLQDFELHTHYSFFNASNSAATMTSLFFEEAAARYPDVSFVHAFPGVVRTKALTKPFWGWLGWVLEWTVLPLMVPFMVKTAEVGERQVFHATSARYPAREARARAGGEATTSAREAQAESTNISQQPLAAAKSPGVPIPSPLGVATGANGSPGSGAYLLTWDGEPTGGRVLDQYRKDGTREVIWKHTFEVFRRVRGD